MAWIFRKLERPCGKRNNYYAFAEMAGKRTNQRWQ
jgi:hypothetical protein